MFEFITFGIALASLVMHFVKKQLPGNKVVAEITDDVDQAQKVVPVVAPILGLADPNAPKAVGFQPLAEPKVTDHRTK
jgi:hypothetical protein